MHNLQDIIKKTAKFVLDNEKLPVPVLAVRARKAAQDNPTDSSIVTASNILSKMAENDKNFITRSDLRILCEKLYSVSSNLNELFASEIGQTELKGPKIEKDLGNLDFNDARKKLYDPLLVNALDSAFEGKHKLYSGIDAKKAKKTCFAGLFAVGFQPKRIEIFAGQNDIIICSAVYDTPKGASHVLIPVEMEEGKALLPTMFLGEHGFVNLEKEALACHIKKTAGKSYKVDGRGLLEVLTAAKYGNQGIDKIADEIEMAAISVNSEKLNKQASANYNSNIGFKFIDEESMVPKPEFQYTEEEQKFANRLNTPEGQARFIHSSQVVDSGRSLVVRKMAQFGYRNVQVSVQSVEDNSIIYAVAIGSGTGLRVPVKLLNKKALEPNVFIAEGTIKDFSSQEVSDVIKRGVGDKRALAVASPMFGMSPQSLVAEAKKFIDAGNYDRAEDIINVLGETDKQGQNLVLGYMMKVLSMNPDNQAIDQEAEKIEDYKHSVISSKMFFPKGV